MGAAPAFLAAPATPPEQQPLTVNAVCLTQIKLEFCLGAILTAESVQQLQRYSIK